MVTGSTVGAVAVVATVVGKVEASAAGVLTTVKLPAEDRSAAGEHAAHRPVVRGTQVGAMGTGVAGPMLLQDAGEVEGQGLI